MSVQNFVFLERVEGYGTEIMKGYNFDKEIVCGCSLTTGINAVKHRCSAGSKKTGDESDRLWIS
jgi:hypothetical protein